MNHHEAAALATAIAEAETSILLGSATASQIIEEAMRGRLLLRDPRRLATAASFVAALLRELEHAFEKNPSYTPPPASFRRPIDDDPAFGS